MLLRLSGCSQNGGIEEENEIILYGDRQKFMIQSYNFFFCLNLVSCTQSEHLDGFISLPITLVLLGVVRWLSNKLFPFGYLNV